MTEWDSLVGEPLAPATGPFPRRPFLEICSVHAQEEAFVVAGESSAAAFVTDSGVTRFAGPHHLTDYHSPLGEDMTELVAHLHDRVDGTRLEFDSLPIEASAALAPALERAGYTVVESADEPCQVLDLSRADPAGWEGILGSKARHELRRKRRRYREQRGAASVESGRDYFDAFVSLHRRAQGEKGEFMTAAMEAFFFETAALPQSSIDVLHDGARVLAAAVGFTDSDGYYLYNSAFDPDAGDLSPGIVLTDALIERAVRDGRTRFDFLKGTEPYKKRLGAQERALMRLEAER